LWVDWTLHGVSNGEARNFIGMSLEPLRGSDTECSILDPTSDLSTLLKSAIPLKAVPRADLLYESQALESAHQSAASKGDTAAPSAETRWISTTSVLSSLRTTISGSWMEGGRVRWIGGLLGRDEDVLSENALALGVKSF
jgi:ubiquitin carboxyl-terminal hydrolase L3